MGALCCKNCLHSIRCWEHDECSEDIIALCCCLPCQCIQEICCYREDYILIVDEPKYQDGV